MSESTPINIQAFQPFDGGMGKRLSVSTSTGSVAIPGTQGNIDKAKMRVLVTNGGSVSAFVRMGQQSVTATLDCLEILPNTQVLLTPPDTNPSGVYVAAVTESSTTKIQITAGQGT